MAGSEVGSDTLDGVHPAWENLPAELLHIVLRLCVAGGHSGHLALAKTRMRSTCSGWRHALPLGHSTPARIWRWEPRMDTALAPHVRHIEVLAPLGHPGATPLPQLPRCARLARLTLRHVRAEALPALAGLAGLHVLDLTVFFASSSECWLGWASGLTALQCLRLAAAPLRLQPEGGLGALLPLRGALRALRLDGCVLLTDAGATTLAQLSGLTRLEVTCCQAGQAGLDCLAAGLPRLAVAELRLQDGVAGDRLVPHTALGAGGALTAHASRAKANALVGAAGRQMPGVGRLAVRHTGCGFLLTAPPSFHQLSRITCLSLPRIQLPPDAVGQLASCTALRELDVEFAFTVRDEALLSWQALQAMERLRLAANFYVSEGAVAGVLGAMPHLQELRLEQVQGGGGMLAPLASMPRLRCLELASCHLNDAGALEGALCSATALEHLRVLSCGIQSEVCAAVVAALPALPDLRELVLALRRAPPPSTAEALAVACAGCAHLTSLDVHYAGFTPRETAPVPAWGQLARLTGLRRLHASTGVGWEGAGFAAVAAAATGLRGLTLTDNADTVNQRWVAALAPLQQLMALQLNSCRRLGPDAAGLLCQLSSLTSLQAYRCYSLNSLAVMHQLRASLPCLATLNMHE